MTSTTRRYQPTIESVRQHPLPDWYDDAKLGIFVHWGLYSVPGWAASRKDPFAVIAEGGFDKLFRENPYAEWYLNTLKFADGPTRAYHERNFGPDFAYEDFQPLFEQAAARWIADDWARLFRDAGAGYAVLTAKHADGYLLWPSRVGNLRRPGYHATRDLVGDFVSAVRAQGLRAGLYYTGGMDWLLNPERIDEPQKMYTTILEGPEYVAYADAHWRELIERYQPSVLWGDIMYVRDANVPALFADYYERVPDGVVNDRFATTYTAPKRPGMQPPGVHHDFLTPEYASFPDVEPEKWETCRGIASSFGYNRDDDATSYLTADAAIRLLVDIVSKNGNLLLNVGPCADGSIHELQRACLAGLGAWMRVNGEAIRGTRPWRRAASITACGVPVRFTRGRDALHALLLDMPRGEEVRVRDLSVVDGATVRLVGREGDLPWSRVDGDLVVRLPRGIAPQAVPVLRVSPAPEPAA